MGKNIGIDFGTTTTEVSYIDKKGHARSLKLAGGEYVIASVLYFEAEDEYIIGNVADKKSKVHPEASVRNFKLFFTDPTKKYRVMAENGDEFTIKPVKAAQLYLNKLIQEIQPKLIKEFGVDEGIIDKAVITVPAQFDPEEKAAVKNAMVKAAGNAGFNDIKLAAEPTAAAVAYQEENGEDGETILVYDFGGGTFDVSVIKKDGDIYTEIATDGDKHLGGNLLTEKIAEVFWEKCLDEVDRDYPFEQDEADTYTEDDYGLEKSKYIQNRNEIFLAAEDIKKELLENDYFELEVNFYYDNDKEPKILSLELTEKEFYGIIKKYIKKTVSLTERVLQETMERGDVSQVDEVVLAGGSSQIRLVQDMLSENETLSELVGSAGESSTLISRGAAQLASVELKVEEKTRFEIGTRVIDGKHLDLYESVIPAGEKLPCFGTHKYYLSRDGQNEVTIEYYEKDIKNYPKASRIDDDGINMVNELTISGIPAIKDAAVNVTFSIESDGTPTISAEILDSNGNTVKAEQLTIVKGGNLY